MKSGAAAMIPKSGLDDFRLAPVVRGQERLIKLLEPERLHGEFVGGGTGVSRKLAGGR